MKALIDVETGIPVKYFTDEATNKQIFDWLESEVIDNARWLELESFQICITSHDPKEEMFYVAGDDDDLAFVLEDIKPVKLYQPANTYNASQYLPPILSKYASVCVINCADDSLVYFDRIEEAWFDVKTEEMTEVNRWKFGDPVRV